MSFEPHPGVLSAGRLFAIAAIFHVAFALAVFVVGRTRILPETFDTNGIGLTFAIDSHNYRIEAEEMAKLLQQGRLREWTAFKASFHVKVYSLSFATVGRLVGFNILGVEPLNLVYYLSILALAYSIARQAFDEIVAQFAAGVIALWPSLILHTTQMLRDGLFIPSILLLTLVLLVLATRTLSRNRALLLVIPGVAAPLVAWLCRGDMWETVLMILVIGAAICVLAQLKERRFSPANYLALGALLLIAFWIPKVVPTYRQPDDLPSPQLRASMSGGVIVNDSRQEPKVLNPTEKPRSGLSKLAARVGFLRHKFIIRYPRAGSNIDTDIELHGTADIIRYLPRAALISFFAPFPNMWVAQGAQVGLPGRLLAGAEMIMMYLILGLGGVTLVKQRQRPAVWLLFTIASVGCVSLGYVVVNISALYRMRYAFFILLIVLGMKGLRDLLPVKAESKVASAELRPRMNQESLAQL